MTANRELDCQDLVELVTDYLEDAPPPERVRFDAHIANCTGCARYLTQLRRTIGAAGALDQERIAAPAMQALLGAFRDWKADR